MSLVPNPLPAKSSLKSDNHGCSDVYQHVPKLPGDYPAGKNSDGKNSKRDGSDGVDLGLGLSLGLGGGDSQHGGDASGVGVGIGVDVELNFSTELANVCFGASVWAQIFGDKSSEVIHTCTTAVAHACAEENVLYIDAAIFATIMNDHFDPDLSNGHGSRVGEVCAAVEAACTEIGLAVEITAKIVAEVKVALDGLNLDIDVSAGADVSLFKHYLSSDLLAIRGFLMLFVHVDLAIGDIVGSIVDKIIACLQLDVNVALDVDLAAKLAFFIKSVIAKGGYYKGHYEGQELNTIVAEIVVEACGLLGITVGTLGVDIEAGLAALIVV
jgi:hypothetical protein